MFGHSMDELAEMGALEYMEKAKIVDRYSGDFRFQQLAAQFFASFGKNIKWQRLLPWQRLPEIPQDPDHLFNEE